MKSKSHRSQPTHTPTFAFSAFPSPTAGIWNTFRRSPILFYVFFLSAFFQQLSVYSNLLSITSPVPLRPINICLVSSLPVQRQVQTNILWEKAAFPPEMITRFLPDDMLWLLKHLSLACSIISLPLIADLTSGVLHSDITKWLLVWFAVNQWAIVLTLCLNALVFQISGM